MRGWLARHAEQAARVEQLAARRRERDALDRLRSEHAGAIAAALGVDDSTSLASLLQSAVTELERNKALEQERRQLRGTLDELDAERETARSRLKAREEQLERWRAAWDAAVQPLGLAAAASPGEAGAVLAELVELERSAGKLDDVARRIASMERDTRALEAEVEELLDVYAPALADRPVLEAAAELLRRYAKARHDLGRRLDLDRDIDRRRVECDGLRSDAERAEGELAALLATASVTDLAGLEAAEQRSERARELERRLREVDDELLEVREGEAFDKLAQAVSETDEASARGRLADIEHELEELEDALRGVDQDIGGRQRGLDEHFGDSSAADAAADAEQQLARIEELAERYARARLAARVLKRELERYREQNQGPIISRAGELFPLLTVGRYRGLRVEFGSDDSAVLRCVRADDTLVDIEALSDGTRDQLYLALRVASLERFSEHNEPLPVVLDDTLVHFDDERARAALEVLAVLARRTQVLFFTHHQRLVELARDAVDGAELFCHELGSSWRAA